MGANFYFLINKPDGGLIPDGKLVSLSPEISQWLSFQGHSYETVYDLEADIDLRANDDEYFLQQLDWIKRFDLWLESVVPAVRENRLRPSFYFFSKIKYVQDSIVHHAVQFDRFLAREKPDKVTLVRKSFLPLDRRSILTLKQTLVQDIEHLLKQICDDRQIAFEVAISKGTVQPLARPVLKQFNRLKAVARNFRNFFYYQKWRLVMCRRKHSKGILFLDPGSPKIDGLIWQSFRLGYPVFLHMNRNYFSTRLFSEDMLSPHESQSKTVDAEGFKHAAGILANEEWLFRFLQLKTMLNLQPVLMPYYLDFITEVVPSLFAQYSKVRTIFQNVPMLAVIGQGSSGEQYPAVYNYFQNERTPRICAQHSGGPTLWIDWIYGELAYFDCFLATDDLHEKVFRKFAGLRYMGACQVEQLRPMERNLVKAEGARIQQSKNGVKQVLFVPRKQPAWVYKYNTYLYPVTWLYEIQKALIDLFRREKSFNFVYKHHPTSSWANSSVIEYIKNSGSANISIQEGDLSDMIKRSDAVIMDFPSTPLFEALEHEVPAFALCPRTNSTFEEMSTFFGNCLGAFTTIEEAVALVQSFLTSDWGLFRRALPRRGKREFGELIESLPSSGAVSSAAAY